MPDTIVEFTNLTGRTYDQLVAGVTIASTTASQQAVVKDVVLTNPNSRNLRLTVDSAVVAETNAPTRFTGSELLGPSESLVLRTGSLALVNRLQAFGGQSNFYDNTFATQFSEVKSSISVASTNPTITSSLNNDPYFAVIAQNGDFYYSDNGPGALYRRAGGVNGLQTQITTNGRACSYDGRYIYSFSSGQAMSVTDTQNNGSVVSGNFTGASGQVGTLTNSAAIDGYVWLKDAPGSNNGTLINGSTRAAVNIAGVADGASQRFFVGIGKTSGGDYVVVQMTSYNSNSAYWWNLGSNLAAPVVKASGAFSLSGAGNISNTNCNNIHRTPGSDRFLLHVPGGGQNGTVIDLDLLGSGVTNYFQFTNSSSSIPQTSGRVLSVVQSAAAADFGTINVRATGILTT